MVDRIEAGDVDLVINTVGADPQAVLDEELDLCGALQERLKPARRLEEARVIRDFSYISKRIAGDGWVLVGDAFGFIDPVYSSGVYFALEMGVRAGEAVAEGLFCS